MERLIKRVFILIQKSGLNEDTQELAKNLETMKGESDVKQKEFKKDKRKEFFLE